MTPAARVQAAIELLDEVLGGAPAERALTAWARRSRFAGSKDRAAVRDHVFDVLRCRNSYAALGGSMTGRGLLIGALRAGGSDPADMFTGQGHAPAPMTDAEQKPAGDGPVVDLPAWLVPVMQASLRDRFGAEEQALRQRAPVFLRVNLRKTSRDTARAKLAQEGIVAESSPLADTALEVTEGARRIKQSPLYQDGLVELQDASSQAAVAALPLDEGQRILDFCAGGGGKVLAMGGRIQGDFFAHDVNAARLRDLPERSVRAGMKVQIRDEAQLKEEPLFDLVFCDVPCSGSGTWRRSPDAKWRFSPERLQELQRLQTGILATAKDMVSPKGTLVYATCSVLREEDETQIDAFLKRHSDWVLKRSQRWFPSQGCDGFFLAQLTRR